jgi:CDP-diacylglycerol--glycerol-3-phosphate 3-phosphatidyltransferase
MIDNHNGKQEWRKMKTLPNYITFSRILLSLVLLLLKPFGLMFYIIYSVSALSDVLDGMLARKMKTSSQFGAKLDSIADLVMLVVLFLILYPRLRLTLGIVLWLFLILLIRLVSMGIAYLKYKTFAILHTWGNKITGIVVFAIPYLLMVIQMDAVAYICCAVAILSAVEEMVIHLTSKELELDRRGILLK